MNILPFVFSFLFVLSLLSFDLFRSLRTMTIVDVLLQKRSAMERTVNNQIIQRHWRKLLKQHRTQESPSLKKKPSRIKMPSSPRLQTPFSPASQWNLRPFLENPKNPSLHAITVSLFLSLYPEIFREQPVLLERLLLALVSTFADRNVGTLTDLYPQEEDLAALYYTLLRGTNAYDLTLQKGIPPLGDFVCLQEGASAYFRYATPTLLEAIFGTTLKKSILRKEQIHTERLGKAHTLTRKELEALPEFSHHGPLLLLLSFDTCKERKKEIREHDAVIGMRFRERS